MLIDGTPRRTIEPLPDGTGVRILDQSLLPHRVVWQPVTTVGQAVHAIRAMQVRGAPLIGVAAAHGMAIAASQDPSEAALRAAAAAIGASRPTAVNLRWALERMLAALLPERPDRRGDLARRLAARMADDDVEACRALGRHGLAVLRRSVRAGGGPLALMTHCNAGWLAAVDRGTALAPVYEAVEAGQDVHVWVSETRPRNQGLLTAWELRQQGVPHTLVVDNAAGALIGGGHVDAVLVGADRIAANGDVANKVGTYLKALACADAGIPCYVVAPVSSIDPQCPDGAAIPIEERDGDEVRVVHGLSEPSPGAPATVRLAGVGVPVGNPAFDVTPARLVTAIVTDAGVAPATREGVEGLLRAVAGR